MNCVELLIQARLDSYSNWLEFETNKLLGKKFEFSVRDKSTRRLSKFEIKVNKTDDNDFDGLLDEYVEVTLTNVSISAYSNMITNRPTLSIKAESIVFN